MNDEIHIDSLASAERFAMAILGLKLHRWQGDILADASRLGERRRLAVRSPNGAGKDDRIIAPLATWWLKRYRRGQVVITTKDEKQLKNQTWRSISRYRGLFADCETFRDHDCTIKTPTGGLLSAFVTDDPARAEGYHGEPEGPLLIIINEAKSVDDEIFDAFMRCSYALVLLISSPGYKRKAFYRAFTEDRSLYHTYAIGLPHCPHISREKVQQTIDEYGETDPFTRSTIYGEFMDESDEIQMVCPIKWVEQNLDTQIGKVPGVRVGACDFAAGGDRNAFVLRNGNMVEAMHAWRERDTNAAVGRFLMHFGVYNLTPSHVWGDGDGLGGPMCDDMDRARFRVNRFHGGRNVDGGRYKNLISYCWHETAARIRRQELIIPKDHVLKDDLIRDLTSRRAKHDPTGKTWLESKEEMRNRGAKSPDLGDAFCIAFGVQPVTSSSWIEQESRFAEIARTKGWDYRGDDSSNQDGDSGRPGKGDGDIGGGFGGIHSDW